MSVKQLEQIPNQDYSSDPPSQAELNETVNFNDQYQEGLSSQRAMINIVSQSNPSPSQAANDNTNIIWIIILSLLGTFIVVTTVVYASLPTNGLPFISTPQNNTQANTIIADPINKPQLTKKEIKQQTGIKTRQISKEIKEINNNYSTQNRTSQETLLNNISIQNYKNGNTISGNSKSDDYLEQSNHTIEEEDKPTISDNNKKQSMLDFRTLKNASQYTDAWKINQPSQLPFCLIVNPNLTNFNTIVLSIKEQKYSNYEIISEPAHTNFYQSYYQLIHSKCQRNALLMFIHNPLEENALNKLNQYHQKFYTWVTYALVYDEQGNSQVQVYSFYTRIYDLLANNDFKGKNIEMMNGGNWTSAFVIGIMQLCEYHTKHVEDTIHANTSPLFLDLREWSILKGIESRVPYSRLYKLSQDYPINITTEQRRLANLKKRKNQPFNKMTIQKINKAIHLQQVPYLPINHLLNALQYQDLLKLYKINKYSNNQLPMCVTVMSYNNSENRRNIKALQSIIMQQYSNYHIVFVDDDSDDMNSQISIQYLRERGFNMSRATFVQNTRQNHVTYNIINAAFNFCNPGDIQVLLDGDDEYIGRYVLLLLNAIYQQKQHKWIVYTNSKSNLYTYGTSQYIKNINLLVRNSKRRSNHLISPVRSWRVKLLYNIPLSYHLMKDKTWLDTVSDTALQHSIVELSGAYRTQYIPQIMYEYNKEYGNNDDSTKKKLQHRKEVYDWVLTMKPLSQLNDIVNSVQNAGVKQVFDEDRNVGYYLKDI